MVSSLDIQPELAPQFQPSKPGAGGYSCPRPSFRAFFTAVRAIHRLAHLEIDSQLGTHYNRQLARSPKPCGVVKLISSVSSSTDPRTSVGLVTNNFSNPARF
jgi:hypothetical protein